MKIISAAGKPYLLIVLAFLMLMFPQCVEEDSTTPAGQGWISTDFSSIPFRQRMLQAERGNLVRNPSFEHGRLVNVDSNTVSHNITAWQKMGENVSWVYHSPDSNGLDTEIRSGSYAIKIHRNPADQPFNQEDGIVSDFIRVIPGNYEFSFWTRLEDIHPRRFDRGRRMDGSIDVRILFYDKNLLLISGETYDHSRKAIINRSLKSLIFNDFWNIDSLGWISVKGKTTHDFLTEGDIPDEAKFVKLYLGLKGTGKMWIDDVEFRYSRRNFSSLERIERMLDTTQSKLDLVIPTPKEARLLDPVVYHIEGGDSIPMPIIVLPGRPDIQTRAAAELLQAKLDTVLARRFGRDSMPGVRIVYKQTPMMAEGGGLIFNIGTRRPDVFRHSDTGQDLGPQAYIIKPDTLYSNLVYLSGVTAIGDYYAAATAVQLLDDSLFIYHQSAITDYPDIPHRAFLISPVSAASNPIDHTPYLSEMASLKLNWAYLDYYRSRSLWLQENKTYLEGLRVIGLENRERGLLSLAQMVNPYAFLPENTVADSLDKESLNRWMHSSAASNSKLRLQFQTGINAGVSTLVLCTHNYLPLSPEGNYILYAKQDKDKYINLQEAHLELIQSLYRWGKARNPKIQVELVPPWYSNEDLLMSRGQAEQYFNDLSQKLPAELGVLWAGPSGQSSDINVVDYFRFHNLVKRELILFDNSMNRLGEILKDSSTLKYYPMKIRTLNLFDPFSVQFTTPFKPAEESGKMLINSSLSSEIMKIRIATAADFMWNSEAYDPDLSIWKILVSRYGRTATHELYRFSDAYYTTLASMMGLSVGTDKQRLLRMINEQQVIMEESLRELDELLSSSGGLLNELKSLKQSLETMYEKEVKAVANQIIAVTEGM
ncbi:beta-N-acetylglucosaminidase domain-containing protein [Bacteroidota bacterium]